MTTHYLDMPEFAARLGLSAHTLKKYKLPPPDITLGKRNKGWSIQTIDQWDAARPGKRRIPRPDSKAVR